MTTNNTSENTTMDQEQPMLHIIGHIHTPYQSVDECPRNVEKNGPMAELKLKDQYQDGLLGLKPGDTIMILYWFENVDREVMHQTNCNGKGTTGTFNLRSPYRPNPIAAAERQIEKIEDGVIFVRGMDCLNGTKLLDIKPSIRIKKSA